MRNLSINLDGTSVNGEDFSSAYYDLYSKSERELGCEAWRDRGPRLMKELSPFPIDSGRLLNHSGELKNFGRTVAGWAATSKQVLDVALGILKIFRIYH
jgi:hypothetical protein